MLSRRIFAAAATAFVLTTAAADLVAQQRGPLRRQRDAAPQNIAPRSQVPQRSDKQARGDGPNVDGQLLRLMQMSGAERRRFFETNSRFRRLAPARRQAFERRLAELDRLPAEEKEVLIQRFQLFSRLPAAKQSSARALYGRWRALERERRTAVSSAVRRLRQSDAQARERILASSRFEAAFAEEERNLIREIVELTSETDR